MHDSFFLPILFYPLICSHYNYLSERLLIDDINIFAWITLFNTLNKYEAFKTNHTLYLKILLEFENLKKKK